CNTLVQDYLDYVRSFGITRRGNSTQLGRFIVRCCPEIVRKQVVRVVEEDGSGFSEMVTRRMYIYCSRPWLLTGPLLQQKNRENIINLPTEHPAIAAYFQGYPGADRAEVAKAATEEGMSLADYCGVLLSLDSVRAICVQFLGISNSVTLPDEQGHVLLAMAEQKMEKAWNEHNDPTLGLDTMAASMIHGVAVLVVEQLTEFLKIRKSHQSN
ncbi:MAG: hypothetical protein ACKVHE_37325, partial [Planctomycetales bacterium]